MLRPVPRQTLVEQPFAILPLLGCAVTLPLGPPWRLSAPTQFGRGPETGVLIRASSHFLSASGALSLSLFSNLIGRLVVKRVDMLY